MGKAGRRSPLPGHEPQLASKCRARGRVREQLDMCEFSGALQEMMIGATYLGDVACHAPAVYALIDDKIACPDLM